MLTAGPLAAAQGAHSGWLHAQRSPPAQLVLTQEQGAAILAWASETILVLFVCLFPLKHNKNERFVLSCSPPAGVDQPAWLPYSKAGAWASLPGAPAARGVSLRQR